MATGILAAGACCEEGLRIDWCFNVSEDGLGRERGGEMGGEVRTDLTRLNAHGLINLIVIPYPSPFFITFACTLSPSYVTSTGIPASWSRRAPLRSFFAPSPFAAAPENLLSFAFLDGASMAGLRTRLASGLAGAGAGAPAGGADGADVAGAGCSVGFGFCGVLAVSCS